MVWEIVGSVNNPPDIYQLVVQVTDIVESN